MFYMGTKAATSRGKRAWFCGYVVTHLAAYRAVVLLAATLVCVDAGLTAAELADGRVVLRQAVRIVCDAVLLALLLTSFVCCARLRCLESREALATPADEQVRARTLRYFVKTDPVRCASTGRDRRR